METDREKSEKSEKSGEKREQTAQRSASRFGWDDVRGPSDEEIEAWALSERKRREAWLAGPSDEEKRRWARSERWQRGGLLEVTDTTRKIYREAELAGMGLLYAIAWAPFAAFSELMRLGARWEEGYARPYRSQRVPCDNEFYQTEGTSRYRTRSR